MDRGEGPDEDDLVVGVCVEFRSSSWGAAVAAAPPVATSAVVEEEVPENAVVAPE